MFWAAGRNKNLWICNIFISRDYLQIVIIDKHETKESGICFLATMREFYTIVSQRDPHGWKSPDVQQDKQIYERFSKSDRCIWCGIVSRS